MYLLHTIYCHQDHWFFSVGKYRRINIYLTITCCLAIQSIYESNHFYPSCIDRYRNKILSLLIIIPIHNKIVCFIKHKCIYNLKCMLNLFNYIIFN